MYKAVCFGEVLWDKFADSKLPGGAPMNVALHLNKQHIHTSLISSVGRDSEGEQLMQFLREQGLPLDFIQVNERLNTGIVEVHLDKNKQASYTIAKPVAWDEIQLQESLSLLVSESDVLVFGSLACRSSTSYNTLLHLLEYSKIAVFDMNLRAPHYKKHILTELMEKCDVLKINEHELEYLAINYNLAGTDTVSQLQQISELSHTPTICLTLGDKGAIAIHDAEAYRHEGFRVTVADTVGAGDAFLASFISGYLKKESVDNILARACATGALVASRTGANPEYSEDDLIKILEF